MCARCSSSVLRLVHYCSAEQQWLGAKVTPLLEVGGLDEVQIRVVVHDLFELFFFVGFLR